MVKTTKYMLISGFSLFLFIMGFILYILFSFMMFLGGGLEGAQYINDSVFPLLLLGIFGSAGVFAYFAMQSVKKKHK